MDTNYDSIVKLIDEYLKRIDDSLSSGDDSEIMKMNSEVICVFQNDIQGFTKHLDFNKTHLWYPIDYAESLRILRGHLCNYKAKILSGINNKNHSADTSYVLNQNINQFTSIEVTVNSAFEQIHNLSSDVLSDEDKELLCGKLAGISSEKDSTKRWEKAKDVLKYIAKFGIEVGKAALPFVMKMIMEAH